MSTSKYADKKFWIDTGDRVIATAAQSALATITAGATGLLDIDLIEVLSVSGLAAAAALLTSIAFRGGAKPTP